MSGAVGPRSRIAAGALVATGGVVLAVAASQPWITLTGPTFGARYLAGVVQVGLGPSAAGGAGGTERTLLLVLAAAIGILGLTLVATTLPTIGLGSRVAAAVLGIWPAAVGVQAWQASTWTVTQVVTDPNAGPVREYLAALHAPLGTATYSIGPAAGLFELTAGLMLVTLGVVMPSRQLADDAAAAVPVAAVPVAARPGPAPARADAPTVRLPPAPAATSGSPTLPLPVPPQPVPPQPRHPDAAGPVADPGDRMQRLTRIAVTAAGGAVLGLAVIWALIVHGSAGEPGAAQPGATGPPGFDQAQRTCINATETRNRALFEQAMVAWAKDSGPLNFDGDPAYLDYADAVGGLDLTACPRAYATAYVAWAGVWHDYGAYLQDAAKPHLPWDQTWSADTVAAKEAAFDARVRVAYRAISDATRTGGVDLPAQDWTPKL